MPFWSNAFRDFTDSDLPPDAGGDGPAMQPDDDRCSLARRRMVDEQLRGRDITDPRVLEVMGRVARERFVPRRCGARRTKTIRCRSDSARRSRSRTSWR